MRLEKLIDNLEAIAPLQYAESWDKVGLHVGHRKQNVRRAMLCIDLTERVMAEAVREKVHLIVAYHPPIFKPIESLTTDDWKGRVLLEAAKRGMAVYSPHTALDNVRGGLTDWLCDGLGPHQVRWTIRDHVENRGKYKVITFVPHDDADRVRQAMSDAGAGWIGNYSGCSYNAEGFGTFLPEEGASPHIGAVGRFERVPELRLEMICWQWDVGSVVRAIHEAHPYEEPAIDVFELAPDMPPQDDAPGPGRVHHLKRPVGSDAIVRRIKKQLGVAKVKVALPTCAPQGSDAYWDALPDGPPSRFCSIAVCPGSGGSLFEQYPHADAYFTGEMQHHQVLDLVSRGKLVILAGHTNTERPFLPTYAERAADRTGKGVTWLVSEADQSPCVVA